MSSSLEPGRAPGAKLRVLERERYEEWDALVERSPHGCIFHSSWWLQAADHPFEILVLEDTKGAIVAGIPLPRRKMGGLVLLHTPILAPFLGPVFDLEGIEGDSRRLGQMRKLGEALASGIRDYDSLSYWVGPAGPDLQGFLWAGFRAELAYTFRFEAGTTIDQVMAGANDAHLGKIRHAEQIGVTVEQSREIGRFLALNRWTFARQNKRCPWSDEVVCELWRSASARGQAHLYVGKTPTGEDAAASLVVNDRASSYHLLAAGNPVFRACGAGNLVLLRAISEALAQGRAFDFEGSHLRGVERHYRYWGARPRPIWLLERAGTLKGAIARVWRRRGNYKQRL